MSDCTSASSASCHFTCPSGGTWYVCPDEPYFVGCCSSDPCTNVDANNTSPCPDVYPAAFDPSIFDSILPNSCIDSPNSNWYTCNFTDPPFLGCCRSNPCANEGCRDDDILAAAWSSSSRGQLELFQDEGTGNDDGGGGSDGLSGGAIAGIVIGVIAALVIIGAIVWFFMQRRNKKAAGMEGHGRTPSVVEGEQQRMYTGDYGYQHPASPYPGLSSISRVAGEYEHVLILIVSRLESQFSSPAGTTIGAGTNPKHYSGSSAAFSPPSLSPQLPSESGRPISEIYSTTGSDDIPHHQRSSSQNYGLGVYSTQKPQPIQELDSRSAEVHELDGGSRT
ncbi:hypothetical protein BJX63DRAFT_224709 [Aspergillus granulosus]|uniref:Uncharacterized protein n=1 Tax=Aspergillus granulosus TaxID=176169 RepID=A0ABR4HD15_9EURO